MSVVKIKCNICNALIILADLEELLTNCEFFITYHLYLNHKHKENIWSKTFVLSHCQQRL
jgi:hypothetical protein